MTISHEDMALSRSPESKPNPDPTIATNDAVERAMKSERDYADGQIARLVERLDGMDLASLLRLKVLDDIPHKITEEVSHLSDVVIEKIANLDRHFNSLADRTAEQKADTTKALTDALAAAKEAVSTQTASSEKSITKSETATTERIKGVEQLLATTAKSTDDKIGDLKDRIVAIESVKLGGKEAIGEKRQSAAAVYAAVGFGISLLLVLIAVVGILVNKTP